MINPYTLQNIVQQNKEDPGTIQEDYQSIDTKDLTQEEKDDLELDPQDQALISEIESFSNFAQATTFLPGIYGYVEEYNTGEKIYLSLTPYEISPRLSDPRIFKGNDEFKSNSVAMSVGNRLSAARVVTNFMQEVLDPSKDSRYGSKDDRIGELTRFLDNNGDEADRSAFMHIVPDVSSTGGKIKIQYRKYVDEEGKSITGDNIYTQETAYVPVNFNFTDSRYSLTIKEFILSNAQENNQEVFSLDRTFDGNTLRLFGSQPKIISIGGSLTNFDDDIIGFGEEVLNVLNFDGEPTGSSSASLGSQRDVFMSYYQNFLKGTKCRDYSMKLYLYYNWTIVEGYLLSLAVMNSADNDNIVSFSGNMVVVREFSAFEIGKGLGQIAGNFGQFGLSNRNLGFDPQLDDVFTQKQVYRNGYRKFALENAVKLLEQNAKKYRKQTTPSSRFENEEEALKDDLESIGFDPQDQNDIDAVKDLFITMFTSIDGYGTLTKNGTWDETTVVDFMYDEFINGQSTFWYLLRKTVIYKTGYTWYFSSGSGGTYLTDDEVTTFATAVMTDIKTAYSSTSGNSISNKTPADLINEPIVEILKLINNYFTS